MLPQTPPCHQLPGHAAGLCLCLSTSLLFFKVVRIVDTWVLSRCSVHPEDELLDRLEESRLAGEPLQFLVLTSRGLVRDVCLFEKLCRCFKKTVKALRSQPSLLRSV